MIIPVTEIPTITMSVMSMRVRVNPLHNHPIKLQLKCQVGGKRRSRNKQTKHNKYIKTSNYKESQTLHTMKKLWPLCDMQATCVDEHRTHNKPLPPFGERLSFHVMEKRGATVCAPSLQHQTINKTLVVTILRKSQHSRLCLPFPVIRTPDKSSESVYFSGT